MVEHKNHPPRVFIAFLLAVSFLGGCNGTAPASSDAGHSALHLPSAAPMQDAEKVILLYGGLTQLSNEPKRQDAILSAVSQRLLIDRNMKVDIQADFAQEPAQRLKQLLASNTPPAICLWQPKKYMTGPDNEIANSSELPLCLNEALDTCGIQLKKSIPQNIWDSVSVRGKVYSIPTLRVQSRIVVANKKLLDQYGWTRPNTLEEFEHLLAQAKAADADIVPIATMLDFEVAKDWFDTSSDDIVETEKGLASSAEAENYYAWLEKMRTWADKGWLKQMPTSDGSVTLPNKWLFCESSLSEMADMPDAVLLPPIAAVSGGPRTHNVLVPGFSYESYIHPEVLVTLIDWMITSEENSRLMAVGIEDTDYRFVSKTEYEWINGPSWPGYRYFAVSGLFPTPTFRRVNGSAYQEAVSLYSGYKANAPKDRLPSEAFRFTIDNSRLSNAINGYTYYRVAVANASTRYILGQISLSEYKETVSKKLPQLRIYLDLLTDVSEGKYDVYNDIYNPFADEGTR